MKNDIGDLEERSDPGSSDAIEMGLRRKEQKLFQRFQAIRETVLKEIASRQQNAKDTQASGAHLESVQRILASLIPAEHVSKYNAIELFVLLVAVYLHDIGKTQTAGKDKQHHSTVGREVLMEHAKILHLEEPEALAVGYVIEGHGPTDIARLPESKGIAPYGAIRLRPLAAILRLADDLDMTFTRASQISRSIVKPGPDIDTKWNLRQCVDNVRIEPATWFIEVQATPRNAGDMALLQREIEVVNARLLDGRRFLRDVGLCYSVVDVSIDYCWMKDASEKTAATAGPADREVGAAKASDARGNTAVVILRYDPASMNLYQDVIEPCLRESGLSPALIESMLPEDTILERTRRAIEDAALVVVILTGGGSPSVHFRLGVAAGLDREILAFTSSGATMIGDLCGLRTRIFDTEEELRQQLKDELSRRTASEMR
jgi:hypothetical protein